MNQTLMERLQIIVQGMSVNSLRRIYPKQLKEWLKISDVEMESFLNVLDEKRLLMRKYDFQCKCGNGCTGYVKKLEKELYHCEICGE